MFPPIFCPLDALPLKETDGVLTCSRGHPWNTMLGIPRMVPKEANYADAFGLQWNTYRKTQLDSHTRTRISNDRIRRCLGDECWAQLHSRKLDVLEAGCGAGRFTEILLQSPFAQVTSIDYSSAVEANQKNCPQNERHRILQADIRSLPFACGSFDLVLCLGVVQHTPSPEETILNLYGQVKPGGWLVFDHYTYSLSTLLKSSLFIRPLFKRLSPEKGLQWTERLVRIFFPLHRALRNRKRLYPWISRLSPIVSYHRTYPQLGETLQYEWSLLDTHDSLTDHYKHLRTKGRIEKILHGLNAESIECQYGGNGVEARCRKPLICP